MAEINLRGIGKKEIIRDLSADQIFDLEKADRDILKIRANKGLDGSYLHNVEITKAWANFIKAIIIAMLLAWSVIPQMFSTCKAMYEIKCKYSQQETLPTKP